MKWSKSLIIFSMILILAISVTASINQANQNSAQAAANESEVPGHVQDLLKKAITEPEPNPVIGIGRGTDYAKVTLEAIANAG